MNPSYPFIWGHLSIYQSIYIYNHIYIYLQVVEIRLTFVGLHNLTTPRTCCWCKGIWRPDFLFGPKYGWKFGSINSHCFPVVGFFYFSYCWWFRNPAITNMENLPLFAWFDTCQVFWNSYGFPTIMFQWAPKNSIVANEGIGSLSLMMLTILVVGGRSKIWSLQGSLPILGGIFMQIYGDFCQISYNGLFGLVHPRKLT